MTNNPEKNIDGQEKLRRNLRIIEGVTAAFTNNLERINEVKRQLDLIISQTEAENANTELLAQQQQQLEEELMRLLKIIVGLSKFIETFLNRESEQSVPDQNQ